MSALLAWLLTNPTVLAIGAAIIAVVAAWFKGRLSGAQAERNKQAADQAEAASEAHKIDDAVAGRAPNANRTELGTWSKQ
ncbi:ABC transporter permease [Mesorhizobium sp. M1A.F.Ca.IN.020.06.1.1]|uniref:ABC transporter permease n=1 Tax=unclassified Mesorhizobium TaxID=325217 RepID=UPI000FCC3964|nr:MULTISPECIES: ABC transporter permease [unclassified Mesorhizobium]RUV86913.1 ABC transporter permease [Mesorhizobium sp. M1A.F.Ca.IN.020.32.1.1]RUW08845.1 ABC transporter permease [Mesorhizobium sp. M1A.F.Ca.IN.022.05.2.1]RUW30153.1 ABC transporter permease [Mesorhizobium sp. M1A.F.Ca.IN.020.06.1.1]RWF81631.1 MAG: ABC transporter permease [Mesorhizobium sp.]RWG02982.1 MAG: ABC transporter permease [Mesorhizobium sp.]